MDYKRPVARPYYPRRAKDVFIQNLPLLKLDNLSIMDSESDDDDDIADDPDVILDDHDMKCETDSDNDSHVDEGDEEDDEDEETNYEINYTISANEVNYLLENTFGKNIPLDLQQIQNQNTQPQETSQVNNPVTGENNME